MQTDDNPQFEHLKTLPAAAPMHDGLPGAPPPPAGPSPKRRLLGAEDYVRGVTAGDRTLLARTITLIESNAPAHQDLAQEVLLRLLPAAGHAMRLGISGVPGVGKSTFIEAFGSHLCGRGHRVAVLTVDPSSSRTGGSILGDKTRMENLSRHPNAFIRPSPSGGTLGGVARKTRETLLVCEAAGFDVILVETMGVGQGEYAVRSMVDFFLLLLLAGAGDELQGMKKGIVELADAILVNKADGDNRPRAELARTEYASALRYLKPPTPGWPPTAGLCSGLTGEGIPAFWENVLRFYETLRPRGEIDRRRRGQLTDWLHDLIDAELHNRFYQMPEVKAALPHIERRLQDGALTAPAAVKALFAAAQSAAPPQPA